MSEQRRVRRIAHRGGALEAPENTLEAFRRAVALGCDAVELDLRATADREVVVLHDPDVERVTDGSGRVADLPLEELRRLDAARWFAPGRGTDPGSEEQPLRGQRVRIPTLAEVLQLLPDVLIVMDLKVGPPEVPWFPEAVAALLDARGRHGDVIVGSFDQGRLDAFRAFAPGVPTSASMEEVATFWQGGDAPDVAGFRAFQVPVDYAGLEIVAPGFIRRAHAAGAEVHVWTVDDASEMRRLVDLGVDGLISDVPSVLVDVVAG